MNIAKCKIDSKGRITLPSTFLKANNVDGQNIADCCVVMRNVMGKNSTNGLLLLFCREVQK